VDGAWQRFEDDVALWLRGLAIDQCVLVDAGEQDREDGAVPYVQATRRTEGLWVEVSSNHYLSSEFAIDRTAERRLLELGLREPGDQTPNYWLATHVGGAGRVGEIFVAVLRDVFGVAHPWDLVGDEMVVPDKPADGVTTSEARRSVDDLVAVAWQYRTSSDFRELLEFVAGFRFQAPFNALLIHIQRPGATYVASAFQWRTKYGRVVRPGERPLVVLQTFGPVMFVYDVSQTAPVDDTLPLPGLVEAPYSMPPLAGVDGPLRLTVENAKRDGVRVTKVAAGSQSAGCIRSGTYGAQQVQVGWRPPKFEQIEVRYDVEVNESLPPSGAYATIAHELGHLYCGHRGTSNPKWWPDRRGVPEDVREFEAEAVAFIACRRLDAGATMPPHLAQYLCGSPTVPDGISLDRIMTAAGQVVAMGARRMPRRKN